MKSRRKAKPEATDDDKLFAQLSQHVPAWGGLVLGGLGFLLSVYSLYLQYNKDRELTVVVADRGTIANEINIGVTFGNHGDTTEVVTDVVLRLLKNNGKEVYFETNLDPCLEPIIVPPNSAVHRSFRSSIPLFQKPLQGVIDDLPQPLYLDFYAAHASLSPRRTSVFAGTIYRNATSGIITTSSIFSRPDHLRLRGFTSGDYESIRKLPRPSKCARDAL